MLFLGIFGKGGRDHIAHIELLKSSKIQNLSIKKTHRKKPACFQITLKSKKYNC